MDEALSDVHNWLEKKTNGKLKKIRLCKLDKNTMLNYKQQSVFYAF